jgi:hypothetical protein
VNPILRQLVKHTVITRATTHIRLAVGIPGLRGRPNAHPVQRRLEASRSRHKHRDVEFWACIGDQDKVPGEENFFLKCLSEFH